MRKLLFAGAAALLLASCHGEVAFAGQVPDPINAPASIGSGDALEASGTNPQQAADSGVSLGSDAQNTVLAAPCSGGAGAPSFRVLCAGDLPSIARLALDSCTLAAGDDLCTTNAIAVGASGTTSTPALSIGGAASGVGVYSPGTHELGLLSDGPSGAAVCLNAAQALIFGNLPTPCTSVTGTNAFLQLYGAANATIYLSRWQANALGPVVTMSKSRSATIGTYAAVHSGDTLATWQFNGDDGSEITSTGGAIQVIVTGAPSTGVMPAEMQFLTSNAAGSTNVALILDQNQNATVSGYANAVGGFEANGTAGVTKTCTTNPTVVGGIVTAC